MIMQSHRQINEPNASKDTIKAYALKYDAGRIGSEKYGEATLSGHLLFVTHEESPPINFKRIEENSCIWLHNMELGKFVEILIKKQRIHLMMAYCAPGIDADDLEMCFSLLIFGTLLDDAVSNLSHQNENNPIKYRDDILNLVENLILIVENHGNKNDTEAAISKLNPLFKYTCIALSHTCRKSFEQMDESDYKSFAKELLHYIMVNKWIMEYKNLPYKQNEFVDLRIIDIFISQTLFAVYFLKNIRISNQIATHPVFQRYYKNVILHEIVSNDIFSLVKEVAECDNNFNSVLLNCQKYSLQTSIYKAEEAANELILNLKKDRILLETYFPTNESLKNFIQTTELMKNGAMNWYSQTGRYGNMKFDKCVLEYDCDFNSWLHQLDSSNVNKMKEPQLSSQSDNGVIPSLYL